MTYMRHGRAFKADRPWLAMQIKPYSFQHVQPDRQVKAAKSAATSKGVKVGQALPKGPGRVGAHERHADQNQRPALHQNEAALPAGAAHAAGAHRPKVQVSPEVQSFIHHHAARCGILHLLMHPVWLQSSPLVQEAQPTLQAAAGTN